jgi:hypothetical protein
MPQLHVILHLHHPLHLHHLHLDVNLLNGKVTITAMTETTMMVVIMMVEIVVETMSTPNTAMLVNVWTPILALLLLHHPHQQQQQLHHLLHHLPHLLEIAHPCLPLCKMPIELLAVKLHQT